MIFTPQNYVTLGGHFAVSDTVCAKAHACLGAPIMAELWHGFTYRRSALTVSSADGYCFTVGKTEEVPLQGHAYAVRVTEDGISLYADSESSLIMGYMTLLDRIYAKDGETDDRSPSLAIDCCEFRETPLVGRRMVHFCVFPETELWELQKFIRFCGALKYSHIVLEFWGMLQYDCLKELAWPSAYTKEQVRPLIEEAKALGLKVIPMFNHWGHASAGRVIHGKHVVLDQNPSLQTYFPEDGWCWDIRKPKVRALLRSIRRELCELCGDGEYFHVGCDEAYNFEFTKENMDFICDFLGEIADEMKAEGRRILAWGDMFLYRHAHYNPNNKYACNAPTPEVETYLLQNLSRDIIIADWQYDATEAPVETALVFRQAGFDTLLCPWDRSDDKLKSCVKTVKDEQLYGLMHTTWHTLSHGTPLVLMAALGCFQTIEHYKKTPMRTQAAAIMRKVYFADGSYEKAGWAKNQIQTLT